VVKILVEAASRLIAPPAKQELFSLTFPPRRGDSASQRPSTPNTFSPS
jgi:hypothetical protein